MNGERRRLLCAVHKAIVTACGISLVPAKPGAMAAWVYCYLPFDVFVFWEQMVLRPIQAAPDMAGVDG